MTTIKQNIMRRVHFIYSMRVFGPVLFEALILLLSIVLMSRYVSFSHIFSNMPSVAELHNTLTFFGSAFAHARTMVQGLSLIAMVVGLYAIRDLLTRVRLLRLT